MAVIGAAWLPRLLVVAMFACVLLLRLGLLEAPNHHQDGLCDVKPHLKSSTVDVATPVVVPSAQQQMEQADSVTRVAQAARELPPRQPQPGMWNETLLDTAATDADDDFDIVYLWVNGSDPAVRQARAKKYVEAIRIRDNGELLHSLRSLHRFMPWWHGTLFLVANEIPCWLNVSHPQLRLVKHAQFFPEQPASLPTFNSQAIENNIFRIPGLRNKLVLMNDDVFIASPVQPQDFFRNGRAMLWLESSVISGGRQRLRSDLWNLNVQHTWGASMMNTRALLDEYYGIVESSAGPPGVSPAVFSLLKHAPAAMFRDRLDLLWQRWPEALKQSTLVTVRNFRVVNTAFLHHHSCLLDLGPCDAVDQKASDRGAVLVQVGTSRSMVDSWLARMAAGEFKFVALNDEQSSPQSALHSASVYNEFLPRMYPSPSPWELHDRCTCQPAATFAYGAS